MKNHSPDIAIIGGGIAGLYCCYRLAKKLPNKSIVLYEATERLGGRIETWSLKRDYDPDNKLGYQSCHANPDDDLEASEGVGV
ncbi:MAG: FAD-dependent oxidoreductase, partial [Nitrososphaera sp.]|nr:FAD-dependent oxidoreductase [Nitrososphaera sp.]